MQKILSAAEMRELDRVTTERFATPSLLLMEAAAVASARHIAARFAHDLSHQTALVLCGPGNNGGDGAALARTLWMAGMQADVILFGKIEETKGDAQKNFEMVRHLGSYAAGSSTHPSPIHFIECETINCWEQLAGGRGSYDLIVDALFGTGLTRPLAGVFRQVVDHLALIRQVREHAGATRPLIVALDLPSGLNADSAALIGETVRADLTVTFSAPKMANVLPPAAHFNGELIVANIGSPPALIDAVPSQLLLSEPHDARRWLKQTRYTADSYKNTHGHALIIAGSREMPGAAVLCGEAALRSGAGLVTIATSASAQLAVAARVTPEVMTVGLPETERGALSAEAIERINELAERATVIAIGPGLAATDEQTRRLVRAIIEQRTTPLIIDADGLNALAPWTSDLQGSSQAPLILTPHEGEMCRLLGDAPQRETVKELLRVDRVRVVREFALKHQLIVALKGTRTLIAAPDGRVFINPNGNAGLGTAGSGDTLTGLVTGFNAQAFATLKTGADALMATIAAVFIGGLAGDLAARVRGMRAMLASDIREHLGAAIRSLDAQGEEP